MILNIIGIDKVKLFVRLYNYINNNTTFGNSSRALKSYEEGQQLLLSKNYDYAHFGIFCDLKNSTVNTSTYNTIYGKGQPVFENIVGELIKELQNPMMPVKFEQNPPNPEQQPSNERKDKTEAVQISAAHSFAVQSLPDRSFAAQSLPAQSFAVQSSPVQSFAVQSFPASQSLGLSLQKSVPAAGPGPGPGPSPVPAQPLVMPNKNQNSNAPGALSLNDVMVQVQNWDRFCKLKDNRIIYFQQQPNSGSNHQNSMPGSCGFISLGTTRDAVLKVLMETNQPEVHKFIVQQMELDLLTSNLEDPFSFTADHVLLNSLKLLHSKLNKAQDEVVAIAARIKEKYWVVTQNVRPADVSKPVNWYIKPRDLLGVMQRLSQRPCIAINQFELLQDISILTDAIDFHEKIFHSLHNALHYPQLIKDYLKKTIPADWMHANIALAWAIATKRTLRLWKHTNIQEQSPSIYLFRDSTEAVLELEPGFRDPTPIDILHTSTAKGGLENHYERLIQIEAPELALAPHSLIAALPTMSVPASLETPASLQSALVSSVFPQPQHSAAAALSSASPALSAVSIPLAPISQGSQGSKVPSPSAVAIVPPPPQLPSPVVVFSARSAGPSAGSSISMEPFNISEATVERHENKKTAISSKARFSWWKKKG